MPDDVPPSTNTDSAGQAGFYDNPDCRRSIAYFLAEREIAVFPLHAIRPAGGCTCPKRDQCPSAGKHPLHDGWLDESTTDRATIAAWFKAYPWMNVGVDLGKSSLMVVDVDNRPDGDGWDTLRAFLAKLGHDLPPTWTVRTGSDGVHYWFWITKNAAGEYPALVKSLAMLGLGEHVDIQGKGKLVVAPGSRNARGVYRFQGGEDGIDPFDPDTDEDGRSGPSVAPDDLVALLTRATPVTPEGPSGPVHTTVLGHLAARYGLLRGTPTPAGHLPIFCPYSRTGGYAAGHGDGSETRTVLMGAQNGSRLGGLHCFAASCTATPQRWLHDVLTDRTRYPDGLRTVAEIDAILDAAGIEPLSPDARAEAFRDTRDHHDHGASNGGPPPGSMRGPDTDLLALMAAGVQFRTVGKPPNDHQQLVKSASNLALFFQHHPGFGRDAFKLDTMSMQTIATIGMPDQSRTLRWPAPGGIFEDHHFLVLGQYLELRWSTGELGLTASSSLPRAVRSLAGTYSFNPLTDFLRALPAWDGTPRLSTWVHRIIGPDDPIACRVGELFILQAVKRGLTPGCKADGILILEGEQGIGKDKLVAAACAPFPVVSLQREIGDGEMVARRCRTAWMVLLAEMAAVRRSVVEDTKAFSTNTHDTIRTYYTASFPTYPRHFVFVGTTNTGDYLSDPTGNRRFWPIRCPQRAPEQIPVERFIAERDQLYAEAIVRLDAGEPWWPSPAESHALVPVAAERVALHPWEDTIRARVEPLMGDRRVVTTQVVWDWLGVPIERRTPRDASVIRGIFVHRLGWLYSKHIGQQGRLFGGVRGYHHPDADPTSYEAPPEPERSGPWNRD